MPPLFDPSSDPRPQHLLGSLERRQGKRCAVSWATKDSGGGHGLLALELITRRSQLQILPPLPYKAPSQAGLYFWEVSIQSAVARKLPARIRLNSSLIVCADHLLKASRGIRTEAAQSTAAA